MIGSVLVLAFLMNSNFPICSDTVGQLYPEVVFANNQYYVFWNDVRYYSTLNNYALMGARVSQLGSVLDPSGKVLYLGQNGYEEHAACDGTNFLVVFRDSC